MKKLTFALGALAVALLPFSSAFADTFSFSFSGYSFSGSGTFTATNAGGGQFDITDVTGSVTQGFGSPVAIATSQPLGAGTFDGNDNELFYPATYSFDSGGVSFALVNGEDVNLSDNTLYFYGGSYTYPVEYEKLGRSSENEYDGVTITDTTSTAPTPEPSSLLLLGTGILGLAGVARQRLIA